MTAGIERKRVSERLSPESLRRREEAALRRSMAFLRGPVPLAWLDTAAQAGGKTLAVAVAIWFHVGLAGDEAVKVRGSTLKRLGVDRKAYYAALARLEAAGLVRLDRQPGKATRIAVIRQGRRVG